MEIIITEQELDTDYQNYIYDWTGIDFDTETDEF